MQPGLLLIHEVSELIWMRIGLHGGNKFDLDVDIVFVSASPCNETKNF